MHRALVVPCTAALLASLACGGKDAAAPGIPTQASCQIASPDAGTITFRTCSPPGSPKFVDGRTVGPSSAPSNACVKPVAQLTGNYAWQKFCANGVGTPISFTVPPGTGSISILSQAYAAQDSVLIDDGGVSNSVAPTGVRDSNGRRLLDTPYTAQDPVDAGIFYGGLSPSTGEMTFPDTSLLLDEVTKNRQLPAGTWSFTVDDLANDCRLFSNCAGGGSGGRYDVTVITKPLAPSTGTLDVGIYLVGSNGYTSATAAADAATPATPMGRMIQTLEGLLGKGGLCLGTITFYSVPSWAQSAYATTIDADKTDPCSTLNQMFANLSQPGNAVNFFLVSSITSTSKGGTTVVGVDGTIPGPSGAGGTIHSGAAVSTVDLRAGSANCLAGSVNFGGCGADRVAYIAAHEAGHWLGLYHTTEELGDAFDPLADTAMCPCATCRPPTAKNACSPPTSATSYQMMVSDCTASTSCGGGDNLMFWLFGASSTGNLSAQQGQVMRGNPVVQ
jgi:hypothetical protein